METFETPADYPSCLLSTFRTFTSMYVYVCVSMFARKLVRSFLPGACFHLKTRSKTTKKLTKTALLRARTPKQQVQQWHTHIHTHTWSVWKITRLLNNRGRAYIVQPRGRLDAFSASSDKYQTTYIPAYSAGLPHAGLPLGYGSPLPYGSVLSAPHAIVPLAQASHLHVQTPALNNFIHPASHLAVPGGKTTLTKTFVSTPTYVTSHVSERVHTDEPVKSVAAPVYAYGKNVIGAVAPLAYPEHAYHGVPNGAYGAGYYGHVYWFCTLPTVWINWLFDWV